METSINKKRIRRKRRHICKFFLNGRCNRGNSCRFKHHLSESIVTFVPPGVMEIQQKMREKGKCYCGSFFRSIPYYDRNDDQLVTKWFCVCSRTNKTMKHCKT